ncbi:MAG: sulfotransferase [Bacteroidales bacterium]
MEKIRVNTLVIGAGRSGTTTICSMLASHPDVIFSKIKEVHFFSIPALYKRGVSYYHTFFNNKKGKPVVASADTYLMIDHGAIRKIQDYNPDMKIVVILRDPVERAYSSYNYSINYGHHESYPAFTDSIAKEKNIASEPDIVMRNNKGHFYAGLYAYHLEKWMEVFNPSQVLLLTTRQLRNEPLLLAGKLFRFLNIDLIEAVSGNENPAAVPKSKKLEKFLLDRDAPLRKMIRNLTPATVKRLIFSSGFVDMIHKANRKTKTATPLSDEENQIAYNYFKDDLKMLKKIFGIDLLR